MNRWRVGALGVVLGAAGCAGTGDGTRASGTETAAVTSAGEPAAVEPVRTEPEASVAATPVESARPAESARAERAGEMAVKATRANPDQPAAITMPQADGNWIADASFEEHLRWDEGQPWWNPLRAQSSMAWVEFDIAEGVARTGDRSAHLHMDSVAQPGPTRVHGVVQEYAPATMPRYLSGYYRVENWRRGAEKQYLQAVVIARNGTNIPPSFKARGGANASVQVAMTLAGIKEPPFQIENRRFEITGFSEPLQGRWVRFDFDLHELFIKHWGEVPVGMQSVRLFFEVRYDQRTDTTMPATADVYFDDLYLGDAKRP